MLTVADALQQIIEQVQPSTPQVCRLNDALGHMLAEDIVSRVDSPPFDKSMMDGFAVNDLSRTTWEIVGELTAGRTSEIALAEGQALRIMTGAPTPSGAEAVIPFEETVADEATVTSQRTRPLHPGANIIPRGQSMRAGETILQAGRLLRAQELAVLAELGCSEVQTRRPPRVAVLSTGDELVPYDQQPGPGQIRNTNALMLSAQISQAGAEPVPLPIVPDDREQLQAAIQQGLMCDFLCLSGGVSAGDLDLVPAELQRAGVEKVFHKVAMKPGKPIWFGRRAQGTERPCYVFGLPGNPVSSMVCFELFVRSGLRRFAGDPQADAPLVTARLSLEFTYRTDRDTYFPAQVVLKNGELQVTPVDWKGSSDLRSTVEANASLYLDSESEHYPAGSPMSVLLWGSGLSC